MAIIWYLATLGLFVCGLMSKPMMVSFPCVLLLLDWWPLKRGLTWGRLVVEKVPFFVLAAVAAAVTVICQGHGGAVADSGEMPIAARMMNAARSYVIYVWQLFCPANLAFHYPHPGDRIATGVWLGAAGFLLAVTALVVWWRRRRPYLMFGWLWFVGTLVPVIGLVQVGEQAHADRYTYIPHVGLLVALVWLVTAWGEGVGRARWRGGVAMLLGGAIVALAVMTHREAHWWRDGTTLAGRALETTRGNAVAHVLLASEFTVRGSISEAEAQFREAVALDPTRHGAWNALGVLRAMTGDLAEAHGCFTRAVAENPSFAEGWNNLGRTLQKQGRVAEAHACFDEALRLDPGLVSARKNRADE